MAPPITLSLVLGSSERAAIAQMRKKWNAEIVFVSASHSLETQQRHMSHEGLVSAFHCLGSMPKLRHLELVFYGTADFHLPADALAALFSASGRLTFLKLCGVLIAGSHSQFSTLAQAVKYHNVLQRVLWMNTGPPNPASPCLELLFQALAKMPAIKFLLIQDMPQVARVPLEDFCRSPTLESLRLSGTSFAEGGMDRALQVLKSNVTLKEMHLFGMDPRLQDGHVIARAIQAAPSLEQVALETRTFQDTIVIAEALETNTSLKRVELSVQEASKEGCTKAREAFTKLMRRNYTVEWLVICTKLNEFDVVTSEMVHLMQLNRSGRGRLLEDGSRMTRREWVEALTTPASYRDINVIYYILSINPCICHIDDDPGSVSSSVQLLKARTKKKKRKPNAAAGTSSDCVQLAKRSRCPLRTSLKAEE